MTVRQSKLTKETPGADNGKLGKELFGLFTVFCGLLLILSLATFDSRDPWLNHVVSGVSRIYNKAGLFGAYLAGFLYDMIGYAAWVIPIFFCIAGARRILSLQEWSWWRWVGFMLLAMCLSLTGAARDVDTSGFFAPSPLPPGSGNISAQGGGIVGHLLYSGMVGWLSSTGALLVWLFALLLAVQMITGVSWILLLKNTGVFLWRLSMSLAGKAAEKVSRAGRPTGRDAAATTEATDLPAGQSNLTGPLRIETVAPLPLSPAAQASENPVPAIFKDDINAGVERPELFRHMPGAGATSTSPPALSLMDAPLVMPDASSITPGSPESAPLSLHPLPKDAAPARVPLPLADKPLSLLPQDGSLESRSGDEDDLPPWVRDFEKDSLGVGNGRTLTEPFRMPSAFSHPEDQYQGVQGMEFSVPEALSEKNEALPELMSASVATGEGQSALLARSGVAEESTGGPAEKTPVADPFGRIREEPPLDAPSSIPAGNDQDSAAPEAPEASILSLTIEDEEPDDALLPKDGAVPSVPLPGGGELKTPPAPDTKSDCALNSPHAAAGGADDVVGSGVGVESGHAAKMAIAERPLVAQASSDAGGGFRAALSLIKKPVPLPPLDLLEAAPASIGGTPRSLLEVKGKSLMTCLNDFGIQGELVGITPGPVVTMFEVRPAPGVRVSRIANLSDDVALALKAVAVRIQAPVPGTDTVGIEIPNDTRETVCLKELLGSRLFQEAKSLLTLILGKDIAGEPAVADLAAMPHLLVAGATGSGKSVGINAIILSLIYKARPEQVQLLLIDPKRVEMAIYADLPHLVHPVVTEMQMAKNALEWAVTEMERRYSAIARASVRNITDYNAKVAAFGDTPPSGLEDLEPMPYLVIIIDELADLMLVAAKEVETSIVRLAQLARAAGIHLILATQRPSVDVVTGLIKANFPCRIAFQVTSKHDSRTILDTVGAEHLLGKGDMLFKPGGGKFRRMHGAFVSDKNVNAAVDYWRSQQKPDYQIDFVDWNQEGSGSGVVSGEGGGDIALDPLYNEAVEFVRQQGKASISLIQRKFRIGFNKAARFVEQMEQDSIIGPADGSRPRLVIR